MQVEFKNLPGNAKIIDIREKYEYNQESIKNSINVPYKYLLLNPESYLDKKETYYLLCDYGNKSEMVSNLLNKDGYTTFSISGGFLEYKNE